MSLNHGDYVKFSIQRDHAPAARDKDGNIAGKGEMPAPEVHIGRVEKNPAQGLVNGAFVDIPGKIAVLYMSEHHGSIERILLTEADLALVLPAPVRKPNQIRLPA